MEDRTKKRIIGVIILAIIAAVTLISWKYIGDPIIAMVSDTPKLREWVDSTGIWAPLVFGLAVIFQVIVAVIPGEPFEIAAGLAFGPIWGTVISMLFSGIGSMIVFLLVKKYGMKLVGLFFTEEQIDKVGFLKTDPKRKILYLIIFMIPGTPKDLLSYVAGLTDLPFATWAMICTLGRFPSIITSTVGGDAIGNGEYLQAALVFGATLLISGAGILIYDRICRNRADNDKTSDKQEEE